MTFTRKIGLGVTAILALAVAVTGATVYALHLVSETRARVRFEHERDVLTVHAMRAAVDREAAAAFAFLLTSDDRQLFALHSARAELERGLDALAPRLRPSPGGQLLSRVADLTRQHHVLVDRAIDQRGFLPPEGDEPLRSSFVRLTQALESLSRHVEHELDTSARSSMVAAGRTGAIVALVGGAVLALAGVLAWLFTRTLTRLYREAQGAAAALAAERDLIAAMLDSQRFLATAGARLAESLELTTTIERVAALPVPQIADGCELVLLGPDGKEGASFIAFDDPNVAERARELRRLNPLRMGAEHGPSRVLESGQSELIPRTDDQTWRGAVRSDEHMRMLSSLGIRSYLGVPLRARGRLIGVMSLVTTRSQRQFGARDLDFAEDFASRAALALDNAALYRRAQETIAFTGAAAHEVRSPLSALQLQADLLARRMAHKPGDRDAVLRDISRIHDQTERLSRLLSGLLDVTQISAGRFRIEPQDGVDLGLVMSEVAARMARDFLEAGCDLRIEALPGAPLTGRWDRARLEQVLANLLGNAAKYGRGAPVEVLLEGDGTVARVSVRDHGIGIAPEDQARIFESYERAVSNGGFKGHGLGLWISRRIVRAMGGDIRVSSRPREGATFTVEVPRTPPPEVGRSAGLSLALPAQGGPP